MNKSGKTLSLQLWSQYVPALLAAAVPGCPAFRLCQTRIWTELLCPTLPPP